MTYDMWYAFDDAPEGLTRDEVDKLADAHKWPRGLARSHFRQWTEAGGKHQTNIPPRTAPKEQKQHQERPVKNRAPAPASTAQAQPPAPTPEPVEEAPQKPAYEGPLRRCKRCGGHEHRPSLKCSFCGSRDLRERDPGEPERPEFKYIALGPNCWGMGMTPEDAGAAMLKNWPRWMLPPKGKVQLWRTGESAYVTMLGQIAYKTSGPEPELVLEKVL
jgi:hypothetical protein